MEVAVATRIAAALEARGIKLPDDFFFGSPREVLHRAEALLVGQV